MKNSRLFLALFATLALSGTAFAGQPHSAGQSTPASVETPRASKIVKPSMLPRTFKRSVLEVRFSLDRQGQPQNVQIVSMADEEVKTQVVKAFKEWRFQVAAAGNHSTATQYVLPLDIIPKV